MNEQEPNKPSQPPQQPVQNTPPVILICPWCSSVHLGERESTIIFRPTYHSNKYCLRCGDVPLLLLGLTPQSWSDPKVKEISAGTDQ
jgi:hypothetical protein